MQAHQLITADLAARLGLRRLVLGTLVASLVTNTLLAGALLFKDDHVSTVLIPVGLNEVTHPMTVDYKRVDEDYLVMLSREIFSLALNNTPANVDYNRKTLLTHVLPSSFGDIDLALKEEAERLKKLRASSFFSIESMDVNAQALSILADGVRQHFIGKSETQRRKVRYALQFKLVAGRLYVSSLTEIDMQG